MTNILSIDTTADICSIALQSDRDTRFFHESRPRLHAKILLPEVERLLNAAGIRASELDYIVFGRGPGSFTGVRIAAGVAQGLAFSADCPVLPVSTLQSLAYSAQCPEGTSVWAALDARMNEIYVASYRINESGIPVPMTEERVLQPLNLDSEAFSAGSLVGNGWVAGYPMPESCLKALALAPPSVLLPDARDSLKLAEQLLEAGHLSPVDAEQATPIYLRDNVTWNNKPKIGS